MDNELPKIKIDERTGIEYLRGRLLYTKFKAQAEEIVFSELIYV